MLGLPADREARTGSLFGVGFLMLGVVSFVVSELSTSLVLQLNAFQLIYRGLCTLAHYFGRTASCLPSKGGLWPVGYSRVDAVVQFAAACVLLFASFSVLVECVHHLLEAHDTTPMLVEAVCSVHFALVVAFAAVCRPEFKLRRQDRSSLLWFLIVEARAPLISFVTCASVVAFDAPRIDVCGASIFAASCTVIAVRHLRLVSPMLLLDAPGSDPAVVDTMRQVALVQGVIRLQRVQIFQMRPDAIGIFVKADVDAGADCEETLARMKRLLARSAAVSCVELTKKDARCNDGTSLADEASELPSFPPPPVQVDFPV